MSIRTFPVLADYHTRAKHNVPHNVPWAFAEKFRGQAEKNHDQTLERLAERGGLDPTEMYLAAHGMRLFRHGIDEKTLFDSSLEWLREATKESP